MADQVNGIGTQQALDDLQTQNNDYLKQQQVLNDQIVDKGVEKVKQETDFQKQQYEQEANKAGKALYADYMKQQNNYGANAEMLASQGLSNSGYSETSKVNLYNNYQSNVTTLMTEMNNNKAKLDLQLNQAYLDADIQKAQNAVKTLQQQMQMAMDTYQLRYSLYRDQISDEHWDTEIDLQKQQIELQRQQLAWQQANADREYNLSLMKLQSP